MGDLFDNPPSFSSVQVELLGFFQATQDPIGQIADVVGQRHSTVPGYQPAPSRRA